MGLDLFGVIVTIHIKRKVIETMPFFCKTVRKPAKRTCLGIVTTFYNYFVVNPVLMSTEAFQVFDLHVGQKSCYVLLSGKIILNDLLFMTKKDTGRYKSSGKYLFYADKNFSGISTFYFLSFLPGIAAGGIQVKLG